MNDFSEQASIILSQLGGTSRLSAMIGAFNFAYNSVERSVSFRFRAKSPEQINHITIILSANDTYAIEYRYLRGVNVTEKGKQQDIYADALKSTIERTISLSLSL